MFLVSFAQLQPTEVSKVLGGMRKTVVRARAGGHTCLWTCQAAQPGPKTVLTWQHDSVGGVAVCCVHVCDMSGGPGCHMWVETRMF